MANDLHGVLLAPRANSGGSIGARRKAGGAGGVPAVPPLQRRVSQHTDDIDSLFDAPDMAPAASSIAENKTDLATSSPAVDPCAQSSSQSGASQSEVSQIQAEVPSISPPAPVMQEQAPSTMQPPAQSSSSASSHP